MRDPEVASILRLAFLCLNVFVWFQTVRTLTRSSKSIAADARKHIRILASLAAPPPMRIPPERIGRGVVARRMRGCIGGCIKSVPLLPCTHTLLIIWICTFCSNVLWTGSNYLPSALPLVDRLDHVVGEELLQGFVSAQEIVLPLRERDAFQIKKPTGMFGMFAEVSGPDESGALRDADGATPWRLDLPASYLELFSIQLPQRRVPKFDSEVQTDDEDATHTSVAMDAHDVLSKLSAVVGPQYARHFPSLLELPPTTEFLSTKNNRFATVFEYKVGDRVQEKRLEAKSGQVRTGVVERVLAAPTLADFTYRVAWDAFETESDRVSELSSLNLLPPHAVVQYLPSADEETLLAQDSVLNGTLAVSMTPEKLRVLAGYSSHYQGYWMVEGARERRRHLDPHHNETRTLGTLPTSVASSVAFPPLYAALHLFCERRPNRTDSVRCSREIGEAKWAQLKSSFPLLLAPHPAVAGFDVALNLLLIDFFTNYYHRAMIVFVVVSPGVWILLNFFRHIETERASYFKVTRAVALGLIAFTTFFECVIATTGPGALVVVDDSDVYDSIGAAWGVLCTLAAGRYAYLTTRLAPEVSGERRAMQQRMKRRHPREEQEDATRGCRICFLEDAESERVLGKLLSPCLCTGTMKRVHVKCLQDWREKSTNPKSATRCDQCTYPYEVQRSWLGTVVRSSLVLNVATAIWMAGTVSSMALVLKLVDVKLAGHTLSSMVLGDKASVMVSLATDTPPSEWAAEMRDVGNVKAVDLYGLQWVVIRWLAPKLAGVGLTVAELSYALSMLGVYSFFVNTWNIQWIEFGVWTVGNVLGGSLVGLGEAPVEEFETSGLAVLLGGRLMLVVVIGLLRAYWKTFAMVSMASARLLRGRDSVLVEVPSLPWRVDSGTELRMPVFGAGKVIRHRLEDDVLEIQLEGFNGVLFRSAHESNERDRTVNVKD